MKVYRSIILLILAALLQACAPPFVASPTSVLTPTTPVQVGTAPFTVTSPSALTLAPTLTASPTLAAPSSIPETASPTPTAVLPTVTLPPILPVASLVVIGLSVGQTVTFSSCAGTNPVLFTGTITVNSATLVKYDWLLRGHAYYNSPPQQANFQTIGTKKVKSLTTYNASCGKYTLSLHIIYPDNLLTTKYFSIP